MNPVERLDQVIEMITDSEVDLAHFYASKSESLPVLTGYVSDKDTSLLTNEEHDYFLFLCMILLQYAGQTGSVQDLSPEGIEEDEERLWGSVNDAGNNFFSQLEERLTPDDVIAEFVLEALERDEDTAFLSDSGALLIYVKLAVIMEQLGMR